MKEKLTTELLAQLDNVIKLYKLLRSRSNYDDLSDLKGAETNKVLTMSRSAIERVSGKGSVYVRQAEASLDKFGHQNPYNITILGGILEALKADLEAGYLSSMEELIHGEVFGDLLEAAAYLLDEGYKDPAAVLAGCVLEEHLRQLCKKNGIGTEANTKSGIRPKKADLMNSELSNAEVYSKLEQKNITAWLDLRNKAAHGKFDEYVKEQVSIMMFGIRDFVSRVPA
jgi:hypothetical protein